MLNNPFTIYNASAGSGKTYALAKLYLKLVLSSPQNFKKILALTFTNKAVNEMKSRILESLYDFSRIPYAENTSPLFLDILKENNYDAEQLKNLSGLRLKQILHNYAFFDISTIDKFTHRLIRTFAKDLKIPQNFEVVLDKDLLLQEAIERVINKAGDDESFTKILLDFALNKIDDDRSWDVSYDLLKIGKLIFDENNISHLKELSDKELSEFLVLQKELLSKIKAVEKLISNLAHKALTVIHNSGHDSKDFPRETLPNHFKKIIEGNLNSRLLYNNKLEESLREGKILKAGLTPKTPSLTESLLTLYLEIKSLIYKRALFSNINRNIIPFALLNAIQKELKNIQQERDQLSISEFNSIIANEIKDQPAPFIYERLGEKYRYYFIDEFQDTSQMQWENLIPLIGNAMEGLDEFGRTGSLFLVGDAKQAIYRWRGGKAEQFLELATHQSRPFSLEANLETLPKNYRSHDEIINFNNNFFQSISPLLINPVYETFFKLGNKQELNTKKGGLVQLTLLPEENDEAYISKTLEIINQCLDKGYGFKDICIIIRKKKHAFNLAEYLIEHDIPIISSDSLSLSSSAKILFLVNLLRYQIQPKELEIQYEILQYLSEGKKDKHDYIATNLGSLATHLLQFYQLNLSELKLLSVYDRLEAMIKLFKLSPKSDAHLSAFMDMVFDVEQKQGSDVQTFINYWDKKGHATNISMPENIDSVQIMTIHKSKGLEFPIVIFPFSNSNIFEEIDPILWLPLNKDDFNGFNELLISKKKEVLEYGETAANLYSADHERIQLDAYNLLYVALTRAVSHLFIISSNTIDKKGNANLNYYSGLYIHYLKKFGVWNPEKIDYIFGEWVPLTEKSGSINTLEDIPYIYTNKNRPDFNIIATTGMLWGQGLGDAINQGNAIHFILGNIYVTKDLNRAVETAYQKGIIKSNNVDHIKETISKVIFHPQLNQYYEEGIEVLNERDILLPDGTIHRPDRVTIKNDHCTIIDYKTGEKNKSYENQINTYASCFSAMNYTIDHKIIVYINTKIQIEYI